MSMELEYAVPGAEFSDYVTLFYRFRADVPLFEDVERADHAQLRFRLTPGVADYRFVDGHVQSVGGSHIIGPTTAAYHIRTPGPLHVFGAGLTPAGWAALIGNDASSMANRVLGAADLFGGSLTDTAALFPDHSDMAAMTASGEAILRRLLFGCHNQAAAFVRAVDTWLCSGPSPDLHALAAITTLSQRQIERKCKSLYGAPPKLLARKYRALRAAVALVTGDETLEEASDRGFYDQSHMIREIKQFTGFTPGQIKAEPSILAQLTIASRHALGGQVHPIISDT